MAQPIITRELSVGEVSQMQHRRNVITIGALALVFIGVFFFSLRDLSPIYAVGIIFLLGFYLVSFINIRIGFSLALLSFLLSPEINLPMPTIRNFSIRIEDTLIIILILAWLGRLALGLQRNFFIKTPLNLPIFLIIIWNIICSGRAITAGWINIDLCIFTNLKLIEFFMIFFVLLNNLNNFKEIKSIIYLLLFIALIIGIYAAIQIPKTQMFTANRLTAPFEGKPEPATLGAYLAIFFAIALSIFIYSKPSFLKKLCATLVLLLPFPIMFSFSRSAYITIVAILLFLAIISRRKWLIILLVIFFILSPIILPKAVISRALYNFQDPRYFGFLDPSAAERVYSYQKLWLSLKEYPVFGRGIAWGGGLVDNQYTRIVVETGLIGLILFLWLIFRLIKTGSLLFKKAKEAWIKGVAIGFVISVLALMVHALGNISFYVIRIAEPFWAMTSVVIYLFCITTNTTEADSMSR